MSSKIVVALACVALSGCGASTGLDLGIDGGPAVGWFDGGSFDGGPPDADPIDGGPPDGGPPDSGALDSGHLDSGASDSGRLDSGSSDSGPLDAGPLDGGPIDAGPLDAGPLGDVLPRFPWNGYTTGSVHDPSALRPTLRWDALPGAAYYRVELTSECAVEGFLGCAFASPERSESTTATSYQPAIALPVATSAPVGRRYFWRVQSCDAVDMCTAWSAVRYLDVGRMPQDFDGDGYADLAIGASREGIDATRGGRVHVYDGSASGLGASAGIVLHGGEHGSNFGSSVAALGDVDADGYADLAVGAGHETFGGLFEAGAVHIHYGGPDGIGAEPDLVLGGARAEGAFGIDVAGAGDLDGDGYADLAIGATGFLSVPFEAPMQGQVHLHRGGSGGVSVSAAFVLADAPDEGWFGRQVACAGDVDGDGYVDLAVGAPGQHVGTWRGRVYVYAGGSSVPSIPVQLDGSAAGARFGWGLASAGDVDGDGYADLAVSDPDAGAGRAGRVQVHHGSRSGLVSTPAFTVDGARLAGDFGWSVGSADVDGDGYDDLVVGASGSGGEVHVHHGGPAGLAIPADTRLVGEQAGGAFGASVAGAGDLDGDGHEDIAIGAHLEDVGPITPGGNGRVHVHHGDGAGLSTSSSALYKGSQENGFFGVSVASAPQ